MAESATNNRLLLEETNTTAYRSAVWILPLKVKSNVNTGGDSIMELALTSGAIIPSPMPYPPIQVTTTPKTTTPTPSTPASSSGTPNFARPIENVTVHLGREAVLTCSVTDLMNYKVGWLRQSDQTVLALDKRVVTGNARVSVSNDGQHTWQLHLRAVRKEDRGCYICQINTQRMKMQTGCIDVQEPPDITDNGTSSDVTIHEDQNATLECNAMGHPKPKITWRREDGVKLIIRKENELTKVENLTAETLPLVKVKRSQMGAYLCIASNDVPPAVSKRITLNVIFAPSVRAVTQLLGVPVGSNISLGCKVEAFPNTVNTWTFAPKDRQHERIMVGSGTRHILTDKRESYLVYMNLTIVNVSKSDMGSYFCNSSNSLGKAEASVRLYEIEIPTLPPTTSTTTSTTTTTTTTTTQTPRLVTYSATRYRGSSLDEWSDRSTKPPREHVAKSPEYEDPSKNLVEPNAREQAGARESSGTLPGRRSTYTTTVFCTLIVILATVR